MKHLSVRLALLCALLMPVMASASPVPATHTQQKIAENHNLGSMPFFAMVGNGELAAYTKISPARWAAAWAATRVALGVALALIV
jgi:hypothetical protein